MKQTMIRKKEEKNIDQKIKWWFLGTGKRVVAGRDGKSRGKTFENEMCYFIEVCGYHNDFQK